MRVVRKTEMEGVKKNPNSEWSRVVLDGEAFTYERFVQIEVLPSELEVIVDFDFLMKAQNHFA